MKTRMKDKGIVLIASLGLIATMATYGVALLTLSTAEARAAESFENRMVAFHWADGAIDQTIATLRNDRSYAGVPSTNSSNGRSNGIYSSAVTPTSNPNIFQVAAVGTIGTNATSYGFQQRMINAVVDISPKSSFQFGVFANQKIKMSGNSTVDSYNSADGPYQDISAGNNGDIGTNGEKKKSIRLKGKASVHGNATVGPGANLLTAINLSPKATITGSKNVASAPTVLEPVKIPSGMPDKGKLKVTGNETLTLSSGSYLYTSIEVSGHGKLQFTGSASVYVKERVKVTGNGVLTTSQNLPTNLSIYVAEGKKKNKVSIRGNADVYGAIYAPGSRVRITGNADLYGAAVGDRIRQKGKSKIHYDKALNSAGSKKAGSGLVAWSEAY